MFYRLEFERGGAALTMQVPAAVVLDDEDLMIDVAVGGLGLAYVQSLAVRPVIASGKVCEVLADWTQATEDVHVYCSSPRKVPAALCAFLDVMRDAGSSWYR